MTRILLLGGTGDALKIAHQLDAHAIYSLAGLGKVPDNLRCQVRVGGFSSADLSGAQGMAQFITAQHIELVIDATHPYAAQISANAASAAQQNAIPCWALRRPAWQPQRDDNWREVDDWTALMAALQNFRRPFFTLGREPLTHLDTILTTQYWTIRCLDAKPGNARAHIIGARGPFNLDSERDLFIENNFDVLISKNSGGAATEPKLQIARELKLPVLLLKRPPLPSVTREFETTAALIAAFATGAQYEGPR